MNLSLVALVFLYGVLAAVQHGLFEQVELNRLGNGGEMAGPGVVRIAVEDCGYLGRRGIMAVDGHGSYRVYVVDCQQAAHRLQQPMSRRGLVADVDRPELNHRRAVIVLGAE